VPFRAEVFDCVFHTGGVNLFNDKVRAIKEMIWVARPGAKIVIVEETDPEQRYPIDAIPEGMQDLKTREIGGGKFYCITFRKPFELIPAQRQRASEGSQRRPTSFAS
jgi:ubiquinone/menaquinone biosynthesis C-methylase UbiE